MRRPTQRRLTRRQFLTSVAAVGAGMIAANAFGLQIKGASGRPASTPRQTEFGSAPSNSARRCPDILRTTLKRCRTCGRLTGRIEERYNGTVPVRRPCPKPRDRQRRQSPSMVSLRGDQAMWRPISDYVAEDGRKMHVPYFVGFFLEKPGVGFPLTPPTTERRI
jgi:hypothetical protein